MGIAGAFVVGLFSWTLIEYLVHGWLGHRTRSLVAALHAAHHQDEHRVFAIRAWLPLATITVALYLTAGPVLRGLWAGMIAGFAAYEVLHFRMHFRQPKHAVARYLRTRHLLHHRQPETAFGVTSPLWDVIFATEARVSPSAWKAAAERAPLAGRISLRWLLRTALNPLDRPAA
ncbi:MAG TPA: sterol desaturase family protein [Candidatus Binataceae bacterium]|jgi:hypothetical protein|nr:sterol desaturase family protein [Candidatus Binataceae bacterium]